MDDLDAVRRHNLAHGLDEHDVDADPFTLFDRWFDDAAAAGVHQPEAMVLATSGPDGTPSARMVLLRGIDDGGGFRFFTDGESQKGVELEANPRAALVFPWNVVGRQIRITGAASRLDDEAADAYFATRPRGSQLATVASHQSKPVADRATLDALYREVVVELGDGPVIRPDRWAGYRVQPEVFEFWQGREFRFHDRLRYRLTGGTWVLDRLQP